MYVCVFEFSFSLFLKKKSKTVLKVGPVLALDLTVFIAEYPFSGDTFLAFL